MDRRFFNFFVNKIKSWIAQELAKPQNVIFPGITLVFVFLNPEKAIYFFGFTFILTVVLYLKRSKLISGQLITTILLVMAGIYIVATLVFAAIYLRQESWDGLLWYYKYSLALMDKNALVTLYKPHSPYIIELLLGKILKVTSINFVSYVLALIGYINIGLVYLVISKYSSHPKRALFNTMIIFASPMYLMLTFVEYKTDMAYSALFLTSILLLYSARTSANTLKAFLSGCVVGIALLSKLTILPFYILLFGTLLLADYFNKERKNFALNLITLSAAALVISGWIYFYGISIPWTNVQIFPYGTKPQIVLETDKEIYSKCLAEQKYVDFGQFFNYNSFLKQPIHYFVAPAPVNRYFNNGLTFIDPGYLLYWACWLVIPLLISGRKEILIKLKDKKSPANVFTAGLQIALLLYMVFYFVAVRDIYWYLLPLFTFIVPLFSDYLWSKINRYVMLIMVATYLCSSLILFNSLVHYQKKFHLSELYVAKATSTFINDKSGKVMDATAWPEQAFFTFVDNYDKRIFREPLYFGYTQKSDAEILKELSANDIKYIAISAKVRNYLKFYGCPLEHLLESKRFTKKYGKMVFQARTYGIEIYEISY